MIEKSGHRTVRALLAIACTLALWPLPIQAQPVAEPVACSHWNESEVANCAERKAVRNMDGVAADGVRPPVERSGRTRAKKALREVGKAVLFVPRLAVMFALIPIRGTISMVSEYDLIERTTDLLYNDARTAAVIPLVGFESGFGVNGGAMAFHKDLFGHEEHLSATARFGGRYVQAYQLRFRAEELLGAPVWADFRGRYEANPGLLFAGFGAPTAPGLFGLDAEETFYAQNRALGVFAGGVALGEMHRFRPGIRGVVNRRSFDDPEARLEKTPLTDVYDPALLAGFDDGVKTLEMQLLMRVDARRFVGLWRRGFWAEGFLGAVRAPASYVHWGTELALDVPIWRDTRILSFRTAMEGVTGEVTEVPFSELPRLGGADRLRGYPPDAFRGTHAALASVEYSYPIHKNVSGNLFADLGRVGTSAGDLVSTNGWRMGMGGGFLIGNEDDITLRISAAGGDRLQIFLSTDFAHAFDGRSEQL